MTAETCPRCGGRMEAPARALSRVDNRTYICPACGNREGLWQWQHPGQPLPPVTEPITM